MKKSPSILLFLILLLTSASFSQTSPNMENIVAYFDQFRLSAGFNNYVITEKGEIFIAHEKDESLLLDHLDSVGNILFRDLKILDEYYFTQGYQKCYTNGSEVKIVASFIHRGGIVITYNIATQKLEVVNLKNTVFGDVSCAYDEEEGNFHIFSRYHGRLDYLKFNGSWLVLTHEINTEEELQSLNINWDTQLYLKANQPEMFYWHNQLVFIHYMETIERASSDPGNWTTRNYYDKIGIHILHLNDYTFDDLHIFDLEDIAVEKIENINFPKIKILSSGEMDKRPIIYIGGKSDGKDCLYKLVLDETFTPILTPQKQIISAISTETFPEKATWDFMIDIETIPGSAVFHFIGFEEDSTGKISRYYYHTETVN